MTEALLSPELMRQLDQLAVVSRRVRAGSMQGERRSPRHGQSVEFADYRPYVPGDDFRQVDWNAYARMERFFLKLFVNEEDTTVHLLVAASRSMRWGDPPKLDFACRLAAAIGYIALANLEWVAVSPFSTTLTSQSRPLRGRSAAAHFLSVLERITAEGRTDLATAVCRYVAAVRRPGPLLILSDLYDPNWSAALRTALAARYDLSVIHILSPEEIRPDLEGDLRLIDDETGEAVEISAEGDTLARYQAELTRWQAEVEAWCRRRGVVYVAASSDLPLASFVVGTLGRHGVVE